jgi:hypothetical protein
MTSIVPPSTASTHSPPTKFFCWDTVTLIETSRVASLRAYRASDR